jgi:hypothetical protein
MKKMLLVGLGVGVMTFSAGPAMAQSKSLELGFTARAGIYVPFEQALRDIKNLWFSMGVDLEFDWGITKDANSLVSIDWFTHNSGSRNNIIPICFNQRWYSGEFGRQTYWQVGLGAAVLDFAPSKTVFAVRAGIGQFFSDNIVGEANFVWTDENNAGIGAAGVTIHVGYRF